MKWIRIILKGILYVISVPVLYIIVSLILSSVDVNNNENIGYKEKEIYISSNGVHLDIIIPKKFIDSSLLSGINFKENDAYFSFGWGNENFYLNTPEWADLTFKNAISAMFWKNPTLIHLTRYSNTYNDWKKIPVSEDEMNKVQRYILASFQLNNSGKKQIISNASYGVNDSFYNANGSYSCIKTCNSWVNLGLKQSGLKAALWTPFDFGVLNKYKEE